MEVGTLEQASTEQVPVFVTDGRRRHHAVRLAVAAIGLLLAFWLAALAAGLIGFVPLPELPLPGTGGGQATPAPSERVPAAADRGARVRASAIGRRHAPGGDQPGAAATDQTGATAAAASPTDGTSAGAAQSQAPASTGGSSQTYSGDQPSFTPSASGEHNATPPRGYSTYAPGKTSTDPPGEAKAAHPPRKAIYRPST